MADNENTLPNIDDLPLSEPSDSSSSEPSDSQTGVGITEKLNHFGDGYSTKEMIIPAIGLMFLAFIFFLIKNQISKWLVSSFRKSPRAADTAGWSIFCFLLFVAFAGALGILDSTKLLSLPYLAPIGLAALISLIVFLVACFSKR